MMAMAFDPFREFDRLFSGFAPVTAPRTMPMDLYKEGDHYVITCDLPGVDPGSIDVNVEGQQLTIRAERSASNPDGAEWLVNERGFGSYVRQLTLGTGLDTAKIAATYDNGVLTVTIPVSETAKSRKIEVVSGSRPEAIPATSEEPAPAATA